MQRTRRVQRSELRAYFGSQQSGVINTSSNSEDISSHKAHWLSIICIHPFTAR